MKKNRYTAICLLASLGSTSIPVHATVTEYQSPDTSIDRASDCEVYYDTGYDFTVVIPKEKPEDKLGITSGSYTGIYDGRLHGIVVLCESPGAKISYSRDNGRTYTSEKPVYQDVGTYITHFKVEREGQIVTGFATVKILNASIDYTASDYSALYDGKEHGINLTVYTEGCEILYSVDGTNYVPEKPEYKEPGTYTTYYKIMKDNYETVEGSNKVIIGTHTIDYTVTGWTGKYDGKPHGITVDVSTDDCEILYSTDGINYTNKKPSFVEVGTYTTYFRIIKTGYATVEGSERINIQEINIHLSDDSGIVKIGKTIGFTVDTDGMPFDITVDDPTIADVIIKNGEVIVTGKKKGRTKIIIKSCGKTAEYDLTVKEPYINLSDTGCNIRVDEIIDFTVDTDGEAFDVAINDPSIADIRVEGEKVIVTGKKTGITKVIITSGGLTAEYEVTVRASEIKLSDDSGTVKVGDSIDFTIDAIGVEYTVKVTDPSIAKIIVKDGKVTVIGLQEGDTTIVIECTKCDKKKATFDLTVTDIHIKLSDTSGSVKINETIDFTVDTGGKDFDVTVDDPSIADVIIKDGKVIVTGKKKGKTKIKVICDGKTVEYDVTVTDSNIKLSDTSGTVKVGKEIDFTVDTDGEPFDVTVDDPNIASVIVKDGKVIVTGKKKGKTKIIIKSCGKIEEYEVTVTDTEIKLSETSGTVKVGKDIQFIVDTDGEPFDVTVDDPNIASVIVKDGVVTVTGKKKGKTIIRVTCGGKTVEYEVTVTDTEIKLSSNKGTVKVDDTIEFDVDTNNEYFDIRVADPDIASVTVKDGRVTVTGKKKGKTKIKITCNGKTEEYEVTVTDDEIKLSSNEGTVKVDDTIEFDVDTGGEYFDIGVEDPDIASVTVKDGKVIVTGKKAGKTTILIECNGKKAKYVVTVIDDNIKLSDTDGKVEIGESTDFIVDTDGKDFDVTIDNPSIAKVTVKDGVVTVTGLKAGTATITITCNGRTASYKITVNSKKTSGNSSNNDSGTVIRSDAISNVKTGDNNNIFLYGIMLIASLFGLNKLKTRKKREEK